LALTLLAEANAADPTSRFCPAARAGLTVLAYTATLLTFTVIYSLHVRTVLSGTATILLGFALAMALLRWSAGPGTRIWPHAMATAAVVGLATWGLNHKPVDSLAGGGLLLLVFYVATGVAQQLIQRSLSRRILIEFAVAVALGLLLLIGFSGRGVEVVDMGSDVDSLLREIEERDKRERALGLPPQERGRSITREVGQFLNLIAKAAKAREFLEIGASIGYSAIWLGLAAQAQAGHVLSLELEEARAAQARQNLAQADLERVVTVQTAQAEAYLAGLSPDDRQFDFAFLDAEKEDYAGQFELVFPLVRAGGFIIADNVTSHADLVAPYLEKVEAPSESGRQSLCPSGAARQSA